MDAFFARGGNTLLFHSTPEQIAQAMHRATTGQEGRSDIVQLARHLRGRYSLEDQDTNREVWYIAVFDPAIDARLYDPRKCATILAIENPPGRTTVQFLDGVMFRYRTQGTVTDYARGLTIGDDFAEYARLVKDQWNRGIDNGDTSSPGPATATHSPESIKANQVLSLCHMGQKALAGGNYAYAHHCFDEALKIDPSNTAAKNGAVDSLVKWGDSATAAGEFDKAHHYYSMAMALSPADNLVLRKQKEIEQQGKSLAGRNPTTILFLSADPTDASRLRLGQESREIREKLQLARLRENIHLEERFSVRPEDFTQALLDVRPDIVHFSGHGASAGELCFEDRFGRIHPVPPDAMAALFEQFAEHVRCVILSACYSERQARAISQHIKHVIGMTEAVSDKTAIAFAIGFYQAIGAGRSIDDAYRLGCVQIRLQGLPNHTVPIFMKAGVQQAARAAVPNKLKEPWLLTIDSRPLLDDRGKVTTVAMDEFLFVSDLLDAIWFSLDERVPPFAYGEKWLMQDTNSGYAFWDIRSGSADDEYTRDNRTLQEANVAPGMTLELIPTFGLKEREWKMLKDLGRGVALNEIANQLGVHTRTASKYVSHIVNKMGTSDLGEAIAKAEHHHLFKRESQS
jgi:tetratricopeptide (TPR) repeat protein/DNA-binding CsgD family transcriptional regulator